LQVVAIKLTHEVLLPSQLFETFIIEHKASTSDCTHLWETVAFSR